MPLVVHTARINSRDPDAFNVTRGSGGAGLPFAPSSKLLARGRMAARHTKTEGGPKLAFMDYECAYLAEMRTSYVAQRAAWDALLARERVVLVCYCTDAPRCHRTLLAGILAKLGADVRGEL